MKTESVQYAGLTDAGHKRKQNEDCFEADPGLGLFLVADGVGGHASGEVASDIVRTVIRDEVAKGRSLREAVMAGHRAVLARIAEDASTLGMGSTVVVLELQGLHYNICWVGDSRAYLWDKKLVQLTADHNRASELLANNMITPAQAAIHPERHVLTQSLGVSESIKLAPGELSGKLNPDQQVLLCSDGLTDEVDDVVIARIMGDHGTVEAQAEALMKAALDAGGNDNITVLVVGESKAAAHDPEDLETTHSTSRASHAGKPNPGRFPVKALVVVSTLALVALWLLL